MLRVKWLSKAVLGLISPVMAIAIFEIYVRILKVDYNINPFWNYNPVIGWSQVPNKKYDFLLNGRRVYIEFNSKGFHDVEHTLEKPPGTRRVVIVGDSYCEAIQVNMEDTFFRRLESMLNLGGKAKWEVINLGVGDFGTTQEWVALTRLGLDYAPDMVICEVFPLNDVCNNTIELCDLCKSNNDRYRPYFILSNGELKLTSAQPFRNFLRLHFVSYGVVEHSVLKHFKENPEIAAERRYTEGSQKLGLTPLGPLLYTYVADSQQPQVIAKGWQITERILEKMAALCKTRNIQFLPLVVPFEACVGPRNWKSFSSGVSFPKMIQDYPEERLGRLFDRLGLPAVLLKESFERKLELVLPYIGGHFNVGGHKVTAETIYSKMVQLGLVD